MFTEIGDIVMPATDAGALVQMVVVVVMMIIVTTLVRRERPLVLVSIGFFLVVLALMSARALH